MNLSRAFRRILATCDVKTLRRSWSEVFPHLPSPATDEEALITLHLARTQAESMPVRSRQYSHAWLTERGLPSMLPDELKSAAEQGQTRVEDVTGLSVNSQFPDVKTAIENVMLDSLLDSLANKDSDSVVKSRMLEARTRERKALGLPVN